MSLPDHEPEAGDWKQVSVAQLVSTIRRAIAHKATYPVIIAVDGRGGAGKTTLAQALTHHLHGAAVVQTDDLAWHEPLFEWGHLLHEVLRQIKGGNGVSFHPPQWEARGRLGSIEVPTDIDAVIVEGTGASQREHADLVDATIWVQADIREAERRGIARDVADGANGPEPEATAFWHAWMDAETQFLNDQRPWERADAIVNGTPTAKLPAGYVKLSEPQI